MSKIADRIRAYVNGPEVAEHYGEWGILRREQRLLIRELCNTCDMFERAADELSRTQVWIRVEDRLPTEDEYLTHHNDGLDTFKRITVAYMTDTIEYTIGCYDGYKWMNQLGNKKINDVVAWKPFELYEAPKGGAE